MEKRNENKVDLIIKYIFVFLVASAIGRLYEFFLILGKGTLNYIEHFPTSVYTLIFAFPYGIAIMFIYFTFQKLDKNNFMQNNWILKIIIGTLLINIAELTTGLIALKTLGVMPWDYSHHILNFKGLISLPITIRWAILVAIIGKFGYGKIDNFIKKPLSKKIKKLTITTLIIYGIYLIGIIALKIIR